MTLEDVGLAKYLWVERGEQDGMHVGVKSSFTIKGNSGESDWSQKEIVSGRPWPDLPLLLYGTHNLVPPVKTK